MRAEIEHLGRKLFLHALYWGEGEWIAEVTGAFGSRSVGGTFGSEQEAIDAAATAARSWGEGFFVRGESYTAVLGRVMRPKRSGYKGSYKRRKY